MADSYVVVFIILCIVKDTIIFMAACNLVIGIYKGLYLAYYIMQTGCPLLYGGYLATA